MPCFFPYASEVTVDFCFKKCLYCDNSTIRILNCLFLLSNEFSTLRRDMQAQAYVFNFVKESFSGIKKTVYEHISTSCQM